MIRKIVKIDEEKCNGCGLCINACHESALALVDGKAKLITDSYCDGLGACLPACPQDAIHIVEREAAEFDEEAVNARVNAAHAPVHQAPLACGCPGTMSKQIKRENVTPQNAINDVATGKHKTECVEPESQLSQWPVQIKLVNPMAPYFNNANLLVAADCTAFAYANMHEKFIKGRIAIIGCPKLDNQDYSEKLAEILRLNEIKSITVLRMEVPCCGGITNAVKQALMMSGKMIPWQIKTISVSGELLED